MYAANIIRLSCFRFLLRLLTFAETVKSFILTRIELRLWGFPQECIWLVPQGFSEKFVCDALEISEGEDKPNGMILCYPVITSGQYAHRDSFCRLLGEEPEPELLEKMSLEKQVTEDAPQAFLWHTAEDGAVPVENSLLMAVALHEKGIPVEMHIYPHGHHGLSLCDDTVNKPEDIGSAAIYCADWITHCIRWIKEVL